MSSEVNTNRAWNIAGVVFLVNTAAFLGIEPETYYSQGMTFLFSTAIGLIAEGCFHLTERFPDRRNVLSQPESDHRLNAAFYRATYASYREINNRGVKKRAEYTG